MNKGIKRTRAGWMVTVTAEEIRKKCGKRSDGIAQQLIKSVEGFPPDFLVTVQRSALEGKPDADLIKEANKKAADTTDKK